MDTLSKLGILADAAKYDAACTSSGVQRGPQKGMLGIASNAGCCHAFSADGRCITLLKVLMSNACSFDCAYCVNRRSNTCPRATFEPRELASLTVDFYKRNYIEGLFLSSGVLGCADATTERMIKTLEILRREFKFNGYVHAKVIPGTSPELLDRIGRLADRLSSNIELPSKDSLQRLCPDKGAQDVLSPMAQIASTIATEHALGPGWAAPPGSQLVPAASRHPKRRGAQDGGALSTFAPAGHATQMIVGASGEDDNHILKLSSALYQRFGLKRVFFSAYIPVMDDPLLPAQTTPVPLRREHRLYQADWLMRFYDFTADELVSKETPWLDLDVDPKMAWALAHPDRFPVEVNDAPESQLIRVPGIGITGARKIMVARRHASLTFDDLKAMRIVLKRAKHFVTCRGKRDPNSPSDPSLIREAVIASDRRSAYNRTRNRVELQPTLF